MEAFNNLSLRFATVYDQQYANDIAHEINISALLRKVAIAPRNGDYIFQKMIDGLAVIAIDNTTEEWAGFCALDVWDHQKYVANTGLIVKPKYRGKNLSDLLKHKLFELARIKFPSAKVFSLTNKEKIKKVNIDLGFKEVETREIMLDPYFNTGMNSWVDFIELLKQSDESGHKAMVFDPESVLATVPLSQSLG